MNESALYPDAIYVNGTVVTLDASKTRAEGVATFGDKIVAVGSDAQIRKMAGPRSKIVDLAGKTIVPGLIEPHNHFILYGPWALARVDLSSPPVGKIRNLRELQEMLKEKAAQTPRGQWVMGFGYDDTLLDEKTHPTRQDLDKVSTDHLIAISHSSGHMLAVNTPALALANITKEPPNPREG